MKPGVVHVWRSQVVAAVVAASVVMLCCVNASAKVVWQDSFSDKSVWPDFWDYNKSLKVEFGAARNGMPKGALAVAGTIKNPEVLLTVKGHCDERGTEEYNRALGERRAISVKDYLAAAGIDESRMRTLSFGKDQPAVEGTGEAVWAQNRRAELWPAVARQ